MAKRGKKGRKGRRRGSRRGSAPKTIKAQLKNQPLLVKGGLALTGLELLTGSQGGVPSPVNQLMAKQWGNALNALKANASTSTTYYPVIIGIIGHKAARMLGVRGF